MNGRPERLPDIATPKRADFPAVPVVIGLLIALLVANLVPRLLRRREPASASAVLVQPRAERVPAPPPRADDDDLGITLRPKPPR